MSKKALFVANTGFALFNFRLPLMRYLADQGWSIVAVANDESDFRDRFAEEGIGFIDIPVNNTGINPMDDIILMTRLKSLYERESPDLIHHFTVKPVIFGSVAAKRARVPAVVNTITGLGYAFSKGGWLMHLVTELYRLALSGKSRVIFQNRDDHRFFVSKGIVRETNAHVIPGSGVNTEWVKPAAGGNHRNGLKFLMVSRMLWSKGVGEYIKAAETVKERFAAASFTMAGGASGGTARLNPEAIPEEWLKAATARGSVNWVGRVPFERVLNLLDDSDVFVAPSYYPEGIPKSLIEAAAKGKPIITTDTPGCREVVADGINGYLVKPKDVDSLVRGLLTFVRHPELVKKMGAASRKRAVDTFDERKILTQTAGVYAELGLTSERSCSTRRAI